MQFSVTNGNNVHEYNKIPTDEKKNNNNKIPTEGNELISHNYFDFTKDITIYKQ